MLGSYKQMKCLSPLDPIVSSKDYESIIHVLLYLLLLTFLCHVKENSFPDSIRRTEGKNYEQINIHAILSLKVVFKNTT